MTYYKVPEKMDNMTIYRRDKAGALIAAGFLVGNELYTMKELKRAGLSDFFIKQLEKKDIKKSNVFHSFGARFEVKA